MRTITHFALYSILVLLAGACDTSYDNYAAPNAAFKGSIINKVTGKTLQTETGDNGIRIKMLEYSWSDNPNPYYFDCFQDGTFNNGKVFSGTYQVEPIGPFVPLVLTNSVGDTVTNGSVSIHLQGSMSQDFTVEPFLIIDWVGDPVVNADKTVSVTFKIVRGTTNPDYQQNIKDVKIFVNTNQYVGDNNYFSDYSTQTSNVPLDGTSITLTTAKPIDNSKTKTFFIRVGGRIDKDIAGVTRYNYNEVKTIDIP